MTESRSHLAGTTPFQNRIPVRLLAPQHVKGRLGQMARLCHEPLARGMNATHLRIISCPREGGEMTGYNPDQQPKCRLTEALSEMTERFLGPTDTVGPRNDKGMGHGVPCRYHLDFPLR